MLPVAAPDPQLDIAPVLARMEAIAASLPAGDGVRAFDELYREVTRRVLVAASGVTFADPTFVRRLDVVFAGHYFRAVELAAASAPSVPRAWDALFEARARADVAPVQFAVAGMNAHINYDLSQAIVDVALERGELPPRGSPAHQDYEALNTILSDTEAAVRAELVTGWLATVDAALGPRLDDRLAVWSVARARDAAWANAEALWALRGHAAIAATWRGALDRTVGIVGRALVLPL